MARTVQLTVVYPDGRPVAGARLRAHNNNAWDAHVANWSGITSSDGTHIWHNIDTGTAGDQYQIDARFIDHDGVTWIGSFTERIFAAAPNQPQTLSLRLPMVQAYLDELDLPELPAKIVERMKSDADGRNLLERFSELGRAIQAKLTIAPITLATSIIEGLLRVLATRAEVWDPTWEDETFGSLIGKPPIRGLLNPALSDRLKALNQLRKPAAHYKGGNPVAAEAALSAELARELANVCYS